MSVSYKIALASTRPVLTLPRPIVNGRTALESIKPKPHFYEHKVYVREPDYFGTASPKIVVAVKSVTAEVRSLMDCFVPNPVNVLGSRRQRAAAKTGTTFKPIVSIGQKVAVDKALKINFRKYLTIHEIELAHKGFPVRALIRALNVYIDGGRISRTDLRLLKEKPIIGFSNTAEWWKSFMASLMRVKLLIPGPVKNVRAVRAPVQRIVEDVPIVQKGTLMELLNDLHPRDHRDTIMAYARLNFKKIKPELWTQHFMEGSAYRSLVALQTPPPVSQGGSSQDPWVGMNDAEWAYIAVLYRVYGPVYTGASKGLWHLYRWMAKVPGWFDTVAHLFRDLVDQELLKSPNYSNLFKKTLYNWGLESMTYLTTLDDYALLENLDDATWSLFVKTLYRTFAGGPSVEGLTRRDCFGIWLADSQYGPVIIYRPFVMHIASYARCTIAPESPIPQTQSAAFSRVCTWISDKLIQPVRSYVTTGLGKVVLQFTTLSFEGVWNIIKSKIEAFGDTAKNVLEKLKDLFAEYWAIGPIIAFVILIIYVKPWSGNLWKAILFGLGTFVSSLAAFTVVEHIVSWIYQIRESPVPSKWALNAFASVVDAESLNDLVDGARLPRYIWWLYDAKMPPPGYNGANLPIPKSLLYSNAKSFTDMCGPFSTCEKHSHTMRELVTYGEYEARAHFTHILNDTEYCDCSENEATHFTCAFVPIPGEDYADSLLDLALHRTRERCGNRDPAYFRDSLDKPKKMPKSFDMLSETMKHVTTRPNGSYRIGDLPETGPPTSSEHLARLRELTKYRATLDNAASTDPESFWASMDDSMQIKTKMDVMRAYLLKYRPDINAEEWLTNKFDGNFEDLVKSKVGSQVEIELSDLPSTSLSDEDRLLPSRDDKPETQGPDILTILAELVEFDIDRVNKGKLGHYAVAMRNANTFSTWIKNVTQFCVWLRDAMYEGVTGVPFAKRQFKQELSDFESLVKRTNDFSLAVKANSHWLQNSRMVDDVRVLHNDWTIFRSKSAVLDKDQHVLMSVCSSIVSQYNSSVKSKPMDPRPHEPLAIALIGEPGSGKSVTTAALCKALGMKYGSEEQKARGEFSYSKVSNNQYWDGYLNQVVTVHEEFLSSTQPAVNNLEVSSFLQEVSTQAYPLTMASVEQKGEYQFMSQFVIVCGMSNKGKIWNVDQTGISDVRAMIRRLNTFIVSYDKATNSNFYTPALLEATSGQMLEVRPVNDQAKPLDKNEFFTLICHLRESQLKHGQITLTDMHEVSTFDPTKVSLGNSTVADVLRRQKLVQGFGDVFLNPYRFIKTNLAAGYYRCVQQENVVKIIETRYPGLPKPSDAVVLDAVPIPWAGFTILNKAVYAGIIGLATAIGAFIGLQIGDAMFKGPPAVQGDAYEPGVVAAARKLVKIPNRPRDTVITQAYIERQGGIHTEPYHKVTHNMFSIVRKGIRVGGGLVLRGRVAVVNTHVIRASQHFPEFEVVFGDCKRYVFGFDDLDLKPGVEDVTYITFPGHLIDGQVFQARPDVSNFLPETIVDDMRFPAQLWTLDAHGMRVIRDLEFVGIHDFPESDVTVHVGYTFHTSNPTRTGDCGGLYVNASSPCVFGLHWGGGGYTSGYNVFATALQRPIFKKVESQGPKIGELEVIGKSPNTGYIPTETSLIPTPLNSIAGGPFEPTKAPAHLAPALDKDGVKRFPLDIALAKTCHPPDRSKRLDESDTPGIRNFLTRELHYQLEGAYTTKGWATQEEAFNGIKDGYFTLMEPVNHRTSSGYPFTTNRNGQPLFPKVYWKKKGLLYRREDDTFTFTHVLWKVFKDYLDKPVPSLPPMMACLKDELRTHAKNDEFNTRLFYMESLVSTLFFRRAVGPVKAWLKKQRPTPSAIGINPTSNEWLSLYHMLEKADAVADADQKNMDMTCGQEWEVFIDVCQYIQKTHDLAEPMVWEFEGEKITIGADVVWQIIRNATYPSTFLVSDMLFSTNSNTSGNTFTPDRNMVSLITLYCYWWLKTAPPKLRNNLDAFHKALVYVTYGDDQILLLKRLIVDGKPWMLSFADLEKISKEYGWVTTAAKKDRPLEAVPVSDVQFLKRKFVYTIRHGIPECLAPVDLDTIREIPLWMKKGQPVNDTVHTLLAAVRDHLTQHPNLANQEWHRIVEGCRKIGFVIDYAKLKRESAALAFHGLDSL